MEDEEDGKVGQAELVADKELSAGLLQEGLDVAQKGGDEADKDAADYVNLLLDALGAEDGQPLWNGRDTASTSASHCQRRKTAPHYCYEKSCGTKKSPKHSAHSLLL